MSANTFETVDTIQTIDRKKSEYSFQTEVAKIVIDLTRNVGICLSVYRIGVGTVEKKLGTSQVKQSIKKLKWS